MDTLALGCTLPAIGRVTDLHRLENARAGRTQKLPDFSQAREFSLIISNLSNSSKFLLHYVKIDK